MKGRHDGFCKGYKPVAAPQSFLHIEPYTTQLDRSLVIIYVFSANELEDIRVKASRLRVGRMLQKLNVSMPSCRKFRLASKQLLT